MNALNRLAFVSPFVLSLSKDERTESPPVHGSTSSPRTGIGCHPEFNKACPKPAKGDLLFVCPTETQKADSSLRSE